MSEYFGDDNAQEVLEAIAHAVEHGHIAVTKATRKDNGKDAWVLVAAVEDGEGEGTRMYPLALLFDQSPFEVINPPDGAEVERANGEPSSLQ